MYFEKHVCNSRTTEPERSLWRPATSKSPQRCKVASPPPPAHCPRSTSRVVRIVRLQRHCCEVAISRECRRHSKCIQREAVVDGPLPPSTSTQQRPLAHDAEASRRDSASAEGTVASEASSAETASRRAPCATPHDGRLAADVRYKINSTGGTSKCATSRCSRVPQRKSTRCTRRCAPRSCATRLRRARAPQGDRHVRHMQNFRFSPINGQETAATGH